jgi:tRNA (Thr-GGU) A37 N-methylase
MPTAAEPDRGGEESLPGGLSGQAGAALVFIGRVRSDWRPGDCPHNLSEARARGRPAIVEIAAPYRAGLDGLSAGDAVILVTWLDAARRGSRRSCATRA